MAPDQRSINGAALPAVTPPAGKAGGGGMDQPAAVFVLGRDGTIIDTSETMSGLTGFRFEELIGTKLELLLDSAGAERLRSWFDGERDAESAFAGVIKCRDEAFREVRFSLVPLATEDHDRAGAGAVVRAVDQAPSLVPPKPSTPLVGLIARISDPGLLVNDKGEVIYQNPAAARLFGELKAGAGGGISSYFSPGERYRLDAAMAEARAGKTAAAVESTIRRGDGSLAPAVVEMGLARLEGVGSAIEVVIRTAAPDDNDQLQTLLDRLAKLSGDGVALVNRTGQIEVCNRKLARLFGYELAEHLRGRSISDLVVSGILGAMAGRHGEKFTQDTVFSVDTVGVTINGSLTPIHLDILAAADEPGERINLICQVRAAKPSAEVAQENQRTAPMERSR